MNINVTRGYIYMLDYGLVLNSSSCSDYFDNFPIILSKVENVLIIISHSSKHVHGISKHLLSPNSLLRDICLSLTSEVELSSSQLGLALRKNQHQHEKQRSPHSIQHLWCHSYTALAQTSMGSSL